MISRGCENLGGIGKVIVLNPTLVRMPGILMDRVHGVAESIMTEVTTQQQRQICYFAYNLYLHLLLFLSWNAKDT